MYSKDIESIIIDAYNEAKSRNHEYICLEHLLFVLLFDNNISNIVIFCGGKIGELKKQVDKYLNTRIEISQTKGTGPSQTEAIRRLLSRLSQIKRQQQDLSQFFGEQFVELVQEISPRMNNTTINFRIDDSSNILYLLLLEKDSHAHYFLQTHGVSRSEMMRYLIKQNLVNHTEESTSDTSQFKKLKTLNQFAIDLVEKAARGKIDTLVGRKNEVQRIIHLLCRRKKNNPLLVGEPGVGKSALVEGLAYRIHKKDVHPVLKNVRIYNLDLGSLVAGTKYRGDFEKRLKDILTEIRFNPNIVLFIDEIHTMVGAGGTYSGTLDVSNLLKPALANGEIKCIGATTYKEFQNVLEKDTALLRRFQRIDINEPSPQETVKILQGLKKNYEEFYNLEYTEKAIEATVRLSERYIHNQFLPDKAIDLLDEAGATFLLGNSKEKTVVDIQDIEKTVRLMGHMPKYNKGDDIDKIQSLGLDLKRVIYGQDKAIEHLVSSVKRNKAGLGNDKPIGSFLFTGPTGVGKTELAKELARCMDLEFIRFDMSEYMEKHSVSRLIGAPPGYVGYDQRGQLTEQITKHPYSVLLLDEIEKAHSDIYNILLQIMDYAQATDSNGTKINFRNCILIMTSNIDSQYGLVGAIGFEGKENLKNQEKIKKEFAPEFLNRLDATIYFNSLNEQHIMRIVDKNLADLKLKLKTKNIILKVHNNAKKWLAEKGYNQKQGARPMERLIQKEIKDKLSEEILFGELNQGGNITISTKNKQLVLKIQSLVV